MDSQEVSFRQVLMNPRQRQIVIENGGNFVAHTIEEWQLLLQGVMQNQQRLQRLISLPQHSSELRGTLL